MAARTRQAPRGTPVQAKRRVPGKRTGVPNASMALIRKGLAAWVQEGTRRAGAAATGVDEATVSKWRINHPHLWHEEAHAHAVAIRDESSANALLYVQAKRTGARLAEGMLLSGKDLAGNPLKPDGIAALVRCLDSAHSTEDRIIRLDAGLPTEITETRDTTPDAELRDQLDAMLRDPKTRAALAGTKP